MTCGLILAAGESRRMGSPKALLEFQGETFLDRLIGLFARRCSPVIVVLGAQRETVRAGLRRAGEALLMDNPDFRLGQFTSMQSGLRAVPADAEGVLFTLVDHPAVTPATVDALLDCSAPAPLRIPRYDGRRGHQHRGLIDVDREHAADHRADVERTAHMLRPGPCGGCGARAGAERARF